MIFSFGIDICQTICREWKSRPTMSNAGERTYPAPRSGGGCCDSARINERQSRADARPAPQGPAGGTATYRDHTAWGNAHCAAGINHTDVSKQHRTLFLYVLHKHLSRFPLNSVLQSTRGGIFGWDTGKGHGCLPSPFPPGLLYNLPVFPMFPARLGSPADPEGLSMVTKKSKPGRASICSANDCTPLET